MKMRRALASLARSPSARLGSRCLRPHFSPHITSSIFLRQFFRNTHSAPYAASFIPPTNPLSTIPIPTLPEKLQITNSKIALYPQTQITTLPNGVRVASEKGYGETATVGVWVDTGSRYEDAQTNGVAHFLEHLCFKGTNKRTQQELEVEVENIGGHLNAYTSREQTVFYAKVFKKDVPQAMDILSDIVVNSKITADAVERERSVIKKESEEVAEEVEEVIFDRLHETAYRGHPLSRTILGPEQNILSITRENILDYVRNHYTGPRIVVVGAGAVDHKQLVSLSEKLFSSIPRNPPNGKKILLTPARFTGSDIRVRDDRREYCHVAYAFPTAGWTDPDNYPLLTIQSLLGGWDKGSAGGIHASSDMISAIVEDDLAVTVNTFNTQYSDTGLFGVYAVSEPIGPQDLMYNITKAITGLCYSVDEMKLKEAKNQLKMTTLQCLDGSTQVAEEIGRQILIYGRRIHPAEALQRIDAVDAAAVKACANRYFYDTDFALAAIGNLHELPDYNWLRRRTYWLKY